MATQQLLADMQWAQWWGTFSALALLVAWETIAPFFGFFVAEAKQRVIHALRNGALGVINAVMVGLIFFLVWLWAEQFSRDRGIGMLFWVALPWWQRAAVALLVMDFWTYWWHRINHEVPFFWRFHKVHHTDIAMDVTTAYRFHICEIAFSSLFRIGIILVMGIELWQMVLYDLTMFVCVLFHHANIGIPEPIDRAIRVIFVTPAMHKVHHSKEVADLNSNYTSLLSVWDRVFHTFRMVPVLRAIRFGVKGYDSMQCQSLVGMVATPFSIGGREQRDRDGF